MWAQSNYTSKAIGSRTDPREYGQGSGLAVHGGGAEKYVCSVHLQGSRVLGKKLLQLKIL